MYLSIVNTQGGVSTFLDFQVGAQPKASGKLTMPTSDFKVLQRNIGRLIGLPSN